MLKHNEIRKGKVILYKNEPYEVLKHSHNVRGRGSSVVQTQIKSLKTGTTLQKTFHGGEEVEEADLEKLNVVFSYEKRGEYIFFEEGNPKNRFCLTKEQLEEKSDYLKEGTVVTAVFFNEEIVNISLPVKMNMKVAEAPPGVKGDRSEGGTKIITLETGKTLNAPLFIEEGDVLEVNTETGEYVRRVKN